LTPEIVEENRIQKTKGGLLHRTTPFLSALFLILLALAGCSAPTTTKIEATAPKKPDLTIQVASLNLAGFDKRFDRNEIGKFSRLLKKEQIDVLSVQGITRYPGLKSRVDFVNELVARTEMRYTFGEMFNNAGRQDGNGIFSLFPQRNTHNDAFDGIKSNLPWMAVSPISLWSARFFLRRRRSATNLRVSGSSKRKVSRGPTNR
jgi:hypothetical protein